MSKRSCKKEVSGVMFSTFFCNRKCGRHQSIADFEKFPVIAFLIILLAKKHKKKPPVSERQSLSVL